MVRITIEVYTIVLIFGSTYGTKFENYLSIIETIALEEALKNAWKEYGPDYMKSERNHLDRSRRGIQENQRVILLSAPYFQPMTSEWDNLVLLNPTEKPKILEPNLFNHILSTSIDFEINNYDLVEVIRNIGIGTLLGSLLSIWILLGIGLTIIPIEIEWFLSKNQINKYIQLKKESITNQKRNQKLRQVLDRVSSALDGSWLRELEESIMNM